MRAKSLLKKRGLERDPCVMMALLWGWCQGPSKFDSSWPEGSAACADSTGLGLCTSRLGLLATALFFSLGFCCPSPPLSQHALE